MNNDIEFKEEILKNIHEFQEELTKKINSKMLELNTDFKKFHQKLNQLSENNKKLIESLITKNVNIEKIATLEKFRNKVDSILITHEIRINNNIEEISSIKTKYDKALIDNLLVPGYVGPSCQFKNLGEYIIYYITEVSKIKSDKELIRSAFKDLRIKTDSSMRTILNLNESSVRRCNDYTDNKISELKKLVYEKVDFMNTKEREIKQMIKDFEKEQEKFKKSKIDFRNELKDDIFSDIEIRLSEIRRYQEEKIKKLFNQNNDLVEKYFNELFKNELKSVNENILEINDTISDIQNKLNQLNNQKDTSFTKKITDENEKIKIIPNFPEVPSLSQKTINVFKSEKILEKITNKNENNHNITHSNFNNNNICEEIINENNKPNKTQINNVGINTNNNINSINPIKDRKPIVKEIIVNNEEICLENKLLSNKITQKNLLKSYVDNFTENDKKQNEIQNNNNTIEKSIESSPFLKEKYSADVLLKPKNSKILIFNYEKKNNTKSIPKTRLSIKNPKIDKEFMKNFSNIKTLKVEKINNGVNNNNINKDTEAQEYAYREEKTFRKIIDDLKNPLILEKKILSNEEIRKNNDKHYNFNNKVTFSPKNKNNELKTIENWKSNQKKWKSERNIKNRYRGELNLIKLELNENIITNGAKILANKKIMNSHITKLDYLNSFSNLYNLQINNKK